MAMLPPFSAAAKSSHYSHKFTFTLSPTNYGLWKAMIKPFFVTTNMIGYIDGTLPCPEPKLPVLDDKDEPADNPNYATWITNDAHVLTVLSSTISEASFIHVQGETSRDLWLALEAAYAPHTSSREFTLKTQLLRIQMTPDETPAAYLIRAQAYADALVNIGEPMKEKDLVMLVIAGLRDDYNDLKTTILTRQFKTSYSELHGLLSDHDFMIKKTAPDVSPAQAFSATTSHRLQAANQPPTATTEATQTLQNLFSQLGLSAPNSQSAPQANYTNRSTNNNRGRGRSNNRGGRGNYNNNYRNQSGGGNRNQFNWASTQNMVYGCCNRCGIGHLPSQCPNRDPSTIRGQRQAPSANFANFNDFRSQASTTQWLPDTGSSNHVAPDLISFENFEPYYGERSLTCW